MARLPTSDQLIFFFNNTATTEIYTLSLHDALPICAFPVRVLPDHGAAHADADAHGGEAVADLGVLLEVPGQLGHQPHAGDRKSTRLNSSHANISYAVLCLKKNKS